MAAIDTGTFSRKNQRHDSVSVSTPPTNGPTALPIEPIADHTPMPVARRSAGNASLTIESEVARMIDPPRPCTTARADEHHVGARRRAGDRRGPERGDADHEHPAPPDDVGEAPDRDERCRDRQQVGVDGPLERRGGRVEVATDARERHRQAEEVEGEDDHRQRDRGHRPPRPPFLADPHAAEPTVAPLHPHFTAGTSDGHQEPLQSLSVTSPLHPPSVRRGRRALLAAAVAAGVVAAACEPVVEQLPPVATEYCLTNPPTTPLHYQQAFDGVRTVWTDWAGADGSFPVDLLDGRVLWLFGDTLIGRMRSNGSIVNPRLVNNSFIVQNGACFEPMMGGPHGNRTEIIPRPRPTSGTGRSPASWRTAAPS